MPEIDEEAKQELFDAAEQGQQVRAMTEHRGWTEFIEPGLRGNVGAAMAEFLNAKKFEDMVAAQQKLKVINGLFNQIDTMIKLGDEAIEKLKKVKQ